MSKMREQMCQQKGVKKYKCEDFLYYGKELNKLAIMLPQPNGHETSSKEMTWKEDFSHDVCRDIVLEVVTRSIRESIWKDVAEDCIENNEEECRRIKNDKER